MSITNISAAQLCKRSAAQIIFLNDHPKQVIVTPEQAAGIRYQQQTTTSKYQEMCGVYSLENKKIYFSWDEIQPKSGGVLKFIEHKQVSPDSADWYLHNSIFQTAIYAALTVKTPQLTTAKFYVKLGNPTHKLRCNGTSRRFYLKSGPTTYKVSLKDSPTLLKFVRDKAKALDSYEQARLFDATWKHNEYEKLKHCFTWTKYE